MALSVATFPVRKGLSVCVVRSVRVERSVRDAFSVEFEESVARMVLSALEVAAFSVREGDDLSALCVVDLSVRAGVSVREDAAAGRDLSNLELFCEREAAGALF
jgi:hypothetical protein